MEDQKILVVDTDPKNLQILREAFEASGFHIDTALDAEKALEALNASLPDLILSEVNLPRLDGFHFLQKLKQNPSTSKIPVVFLTNRRDLQDRVRSLRGGVKDYLIKPVHVKEVIARIRMILRRLERVKKDELESTDNLVGRLEETSLVELIENFGMERRSGILNVYNENNKNGEIHFRQGGIVHASLGMLKAEKAIYQMLPWKSGHYIISFKEVNTADSISVSNLGLLLQGFKRLEQRENLVKQLPSLETTFVLSPTFKQIISQRELGSDVAKFLNLINGKRDIQQIIDESVYDDIKTLERLVKLVQQGFILPGTAEQEATPQIKVSGTIEPEDIAEHPLPETSFKINQEATAESAFVEAETERKAKNFHESGTSASIDRFHEKNIKVPEPQQPEEIPDTDLTAESEEGTPEIGDFTDTQAFFPLVDSFEDEIDSEVPGTISSNGDGTEVNEKFSTPMPLDMPEFAPDDDILEIIRELNMDKEFTANKDNNSESIEHAEMSTQDIAEFVDTDDDEAIDIYDESTDQELFTENNSSEDIITEENEIDSRQQDKQFEEPKPKKHLAFSFPKRVYGDFFDETRTIKNDQFEVDEALTEYDAETRIHDETKDAHTSDVKENEIDQTQAIPVFPSENGVDNSNLIISDDSLDLHPVGTIEETTEIVVDQSTEQTLAEEEAASSSIFPEEYEPVDSVEMAEINRVFLNYLPFAQNEPGSFIIIGPTQDVADDLAAKICRTQRHLSGTANEFSMGTIQLSESRIFKVIAFSMEHQFTHILNGIQKNLTGFLLLFQAGDKKQVDYLNYFYSALHNKYKRPTGIAILKSAGKKSLSTATIRDLINGDDSDFIEHLNGLQLTNIAVLLSDMLEHHSSYKNQAK